ncbi:MAG: NAD(P)H-dependent oxidoreductase subunit E [Candidatus Hydrogenedentes bacterium]|nr:NAD(P)H-dependent oxidoreductase subunit E [Candidatus Hydrogenedentota bacterium]
MRAQIDEREILSIIGRHNAECGGLIAMLEEIQAVHGYLPEEALRLVARAGGRSLADVYGVATFYRSFSLKPRGRHYICACMGTACHVRCAPMVVEELERQLGIQSGETTEDGEFTLETVNCLGACALGPIVVVDGTYHSKVDAAGVRRILKKIRVEPKPSSSEPKVTVQSL